MNGEILTANKSVSIKDDLVFTLFVGGWDAERERERQRERGRE